MKDGVLGFLEVLSVWILRYKGDDLSQVIIPLIFSTSLYTFSFLRIRLQDEAITFCPLST